MAKTREPNTKIENIQEIIVSELLKDGIINEKNEILDKKAFLRFIDEKKQEIQPELDDTIKDGVVIDQYSYNILGTAMEYLDKMAEQMSTKPSYIGTLYSIKDNLEERIEQKEKIKAEKRKQREENKKARDLANEPQKIPYYGAMLKSGIINEQMEILNKKAFTEFIDHKIQEYEDEFSSLEEEEGVIMPHDRNRANMIIKEIRYLNDMKDNMAVNPYLPKEMEDIGVARAQEQIRKQEERKAKRFEKGGKEVVKKSNFLKSAKRKLANLFGLSK